VTGYVPGTNSIIVKCTYDVTTMRHVLTVFDGTYEENFENIFSRYNIISLINLTKRRKEKINEN
jgi:hypothetical protein